MERIVSIDSREIGKGRPTYIVASLGVNHNGDVDIAQKLIESALEAKVDAVKFQKWTPSESVPEAQKKLFRETPWGHITYLDMRNKLEFDNNQYTRLIQFCQEKGISWFASVWDKSAVDFMERLNTPAYKIPSAACTDEDLIRHTRSTGKPVLLATGMSTMEQIRKAVGIAGVENLVIIHTTSTFPCEPGELNLRTIQTLKREFPGVPVGYSGHEVGLVTSSVAVSLGACLVERLITLDRAMWGGEQGGSIEPAGFKRLVFSIRTTEAALGDGKKRVYESELSSLSKHRRF